MATPQVDFNGCPFNPALTPAVLFTQYIAKRNELLGLINDLKHTEFKEAIQADLAKLIPTKKKKPTRKVKQSGVTKKKKKAKKADKKKKK